MSRKLFSLIFILGTTVSFFGSCSSELEDKQGPEVSNVPLLEEEYYSGGKLGTAFNETTSCFEQATAAISNQGLDDAFLRGEKFFDNPFGFEHDTEMTNRHGVGPVYIRTSCKHCHPGYGHGKRVDVFNADEVGNGYLLVVYTAGADGIFETEDDLYDTNLTGMPQTRALKPFKAPVDESKIKIEWKKHTDEYGNKFPDGEIYDLTYPEITIPEDAIYVDMPKEYKVKLEATIGIYGTGLLDAITEEDIDLQAETTASKPYAGRRGKSIKQPDGSTRKGRYTYGLSRGVLQNGPGSNAFWNITNVTRESSNPLYTTNYMTDAYAEKASNDPDILNALSDTYYSFLGGENATAKVYNYLRYNSLSGEKNEGEDMNDPTKQKPVEFELDNYVDFMVWHRGLAVPAARDLDNPDVQRGKNLFYSDNLGCTSCHRPSWTTGSDDYVGDADLVGKLPKYPNQKIWPYSDMLQHNLAMVNNIRTGWCRTTPLWGRYLNLKATGESSHLHDMRARNYTEAIMWHGGQAEYSKKAFYNLPKSDRDAMVKFLQSI